MFKGAAEKVKAALAGSKVQDIDDIEKLEKVIGDAVHRHLDRAYRRAPLVTVVVVDA